VAASWMSAAVSPRSMRAAASARRRRPKADRPVVSRCEEGRWKHRPFSLSGAPAGMPGILSLRGTGHSIPDGR
jgi:hypothetical protein